MLYVRKVAGESIPSRRNGKPPTKEDGDERGMLIYGWRAAPFRKIAEHLLWGTKSARFWAKANTERLPRAPVLSSLNVYYLLFLYRKFK